MSAKLRTEPEDDPQDYCIKRVCGRIAGGLMLDTPTNDLKEVVVYIQQEIDWREHGKDEFRELAKHPF